MSNESRGLRDMPLQADETDFLGIDRYAQALAEFIRECQTPMTIGIQGDWGSGKTSLMNLVEGRLKRGSTIPCITLNMWQYAQETNTAALPYIVLAALVRRLEPDPAPATKIGGYFKRAVESINLNKVEVMGIAFERGDGDKTEEPAGIEDVKKLMAEMVQTRMKVARAERLVVFVDDLDRILPLRAVELLEVLKNFVDVPGCVFVLACDYQVVVKGLKKRFDVGEDDLGGRSFFDKIIQVPFRMPVHRYDVHTYVAEILKRIDWPHAEQDLDQYIGLLAHSIGFNPRSLKRLGNTLLLIRKVAQMDADENVRSSLNDPNRLKVLFGLCCMEACYDSVFGQMSRIAEEDAKSLEELLLKPKEALAAESWKNITEVSGFDDVRPRLEEFLEQLGAIVDADKSKSVDKDEAKILSEMLKLTAVTSVDGGASAKRAPNRSSDQLIEVADKQGTRAIVDVLRASLGGRLRERRTRTTFSFDGRWRVGNRWSRRSCAALYMESSKPGCCRVWLCLNRLQELAGEGAEDVAAFESLASFLRTTFSDCREEADEEWENFTIVIGDDDNLRRLCTLLEGLKKSP